MNGDTVAEFGLKPCGFWRHEGTFIGGGHKIGNGSGIKDEGDGILPAVHHFFEFFDATVHAGETYAGVRARILDEEDRAEQSVLEDGDV